MGERIIWRSDESRSAITLEMDEDNTVVIDDGDRIMLTPEQMTAMCASWQEYCERRAGGDV